MHYHEDIHYFSYKMTSVNFLSQAMKRKKKDYAAKLLNKIKHPLSPNKICFFLHEKNFCLNKMVNSQNNRLLVLSQQNVPISMKTKHPVSIMVLGWSLRMMTQYLHWSSNTASHSIWRPTSYQEEVGPTWIERMPAEDPTSDNRIAPSRGAHCWLSKNFCDYITPNIWLPFSSDYDPLDYCVKCGWARDQQNSLQHQRWTKDKDNGRIYLFKWREHQKDLREILKLSVGHSWSQYLFRWKKLIHPSG